MNNTMTVTTKKTLVNGKTYYEGVVNMPGLATTKLKKSDGSTLYGALSNLRQAANNLAENCYMVLDFVDNPRIAAKKSSVR